MRSGCIVFTVCMAILLSVSAACSQQVIAGKVRKPDALPQEITPGPQALRVRADAVAGVILPLTKNLTLQTARTAIAGVDLSLEMPSWHAYPWQQYLGNPTLGVGVSAIYLGHPTLGLMVATYPYMAFRLVDNADFRLSIKTATGLSFFTKYYYNTDTDPQRFYSEAANTSIGSVVNVYLAAGIDMAFPLKKGWEIHLAADYRHASNGSVIQPNGGLNMVTASLGAAYNIPHCTNCDRYRPIKKFGPLPYEWSLLFSVSAGSRQLFYLDHLNLPIGNIHIGGSYNIGNWYAIGLATDLFYDGAFTRQGVTPDMSDEQKAEQQQYTRFGRYLITDDNFSNRLRLGLALTNEMRIGRITMLLDWGIYLYNPLRNRMLTPHPRYGNNRPMFYTYDIDTDDGWNYFRLGIRCRVWDNIFVQASVKTHLHKAEMLEWTVGYQIPWRRRNSNHSSLTATFDGFEIYHPEREM